MSVTVSRRNFGAIWRGITIGLFLVLRDVLRRGFHDGQSSNGDTPKALRVTPVARDAKIFSRRLDLRQTLERTGGDHDTRSLGSTEGSGSRS